MSENKETKTYVDIDLGGKEVVTLDQQHCEICPNCKIRMNRNTADIDTIVQEENKSLGGSYHDINVSVEVLCCPKCYLTLVRER
ncbi:MAG: hypothetical protein ABF289_18050 [Clostridiales bacterium]